MSAITLRNVVIFTVIVLLILGCIIGGIIWDLKSKSGEADERQKLVNGQGAYYSFFTMILVNTVSYVAVTTLGINFDMKVMFLCSVLFGGMSFVLYAIWNDSLFTIIWTKKKWISILILWILMICYLAMSYIKNGFIDNLILSISASIILLIVLINLFAKALRDKKQEKLDAQDD